MNNLSIAYFISSHGFGHAARASAVISATQQQSPSINFELFTQTPRWLFDESLNQPYGYHETLTDIGLAQQSAMLEDLVETQRRLDAFLPFDPALVNRLADQVQQLDCRLILCDIAPLGIAVARVAGVKSILIENFRWDWIYEGYLHQQPNLATHIDYLRGVFHQADYAIQAQPVCQPDANALTVPPISRKVRQPVAQTRQQLGISPSAQVVLVTMGGVAWRDDFADQLAQQSEFEIILAGQPQTERRGRLLLLGKSAGVYHPDLLNACDAVVGKIGYSTLAEAYQAGLPYGYVTRQQFRESASLVEFAHQTLSALEITEADLINGNWLEVIPQLLDMPRRPHHENNGADAVAQFVKNEVNSQLTLS